MRSPGPTTGFHEFRGLMFLMYDLERWRVNDIEAHAPEAFGKIDFLAEKKARKIEGTTGTKILA
jgi:hypothetical protein